MANLQKKSIVDSLIEAIKNANFALITFEKTTHGSLENLRRDLKKQDTSFKVIKNVLFEKAVNKLSQSEKAFRNISTKVLPLANKSAILVFKGEWLDGLKKYYSTIKEDENFSFKFGYIDKELYQKDDMMRLANLPGRDELIAKIIGSLKNPMTRTTRALTYNMQKFVYILSQKAQQ